ncbi:glucose dehydrogenase [Caerostris darwini]|uniref:Glucose dehydrogenase n=1 Tax=Caerostris darwini TaxID=1538125 RepID=A0AAV4M851_9ARAC|nr:glucose dehydrogenase [Caerostris darwini]
MYNLTLETSYPTPYAASQLLPLILLSMAGQKHTPDTKTEIKDAYDYIIVGGGSAGSVVASRLAEKHCVNVLLLEAGKSPPKVTDIPTVARSFIQSDIDWIYSTAPQEHTGAGLVNRSVAWPSGKAIGGSGVINAMLNLRGNSKNYDDWAAGGAVGWSYDEVLPYFKKLENNTNSDFAHNGFHGVEGPISVSKPEYESELKAAVFDYAEKKGYRIGDINGGQATGFYDLQATIGKGQRCSAAKAYLVPKEDEPNLDIVAKAFVTKIIIENQQAKGVEFDFNGEKRQVRAYKEVIMAAGTVNTAQLLMLSGIGPRAELEKHKIPVKVDLPVGKNLQDHWAALINFELGRKIKPFVKKQTDTAEIHKYITSKKGPLTSPQGVNLLAFLNRNEPIAEGNYPDHQLYFWEGATGPAEKQLNIKPEYFEAIFGPYKEKPFFMCLSQILHPKSRGEVTLRSSSPYDPPVIDPKYFSHPDDMDVIVEGLKKCKAIGQSESLKKIGAKLFTTVFPGCEDSRNNDDQYFRCISRAIVITLNHQIGTAKMGNPRDPSVVVDPKLRVKLVRNLRVVDASVMPSIPGGNTNVPTMMVAEKASDIIKEDIKCEDDNDLHAFVADY